MHAQVTPQLQALVEMNVHPTITQHLKFRIFRVAVGPGALEYLVNIWAHCQDRQRGENWGKVSPTYVEMAAGWNGEPGALFEALLAPYNGKPGWIHMVDGEVIVTGWNVENKSLIQSWCGSPHSTVLRTRFQKFLELYPPRGRKTDPQASPGLGLETLPPGDRSYIKGSDLSTHTHTPPSIGDPPAPPALSAPRPTPTLEEAVRFVSENEPRVVDENLGREWPLLEDVRRAYLSLEATKAEDGAWMWGKRRATDWRAVLLLRLGDQRGKENENQRAPAAVSAKEERETHAPVR